MHYYWIDNHYNNNDDDNDDNSSEDPSKAPHTNKTPTGHWIRLNITKPPKSSCSLNCTIKLLRIERLRQSYHIHWHHLTSANTCIDHNTWAFLELNLALHQVAATLTKESVRQKRNTRHAKQLFNTEFLQESSHPMHSIHSTYFGSLLAFPFLSFPSTLSYYFFLSFSLSFLAFLLVAGRERERERERSQDDGRGCGEDRKKPGRVWEAANRGLGTGPAAGARGRGTGSSESGGRGGMGGGARTEPETTADCLTRVWGACHVRPSHVCLDKHGL